MLKYLISEKTAILFIIIGMLILLVTVVIFMHPYYSLNMTRPADTQLISHYGDIVGGLTGSLWALAGVILFYLALESQKESYRLNQLSVNKQVEALELQIKEFKIQGKIFTRTAKAQENTVKSMKEQYHLNEYIAVLDIYSTLTQVNSDLARISESHKVREKFKKRSMKYITMLEIELEKSSQIKINNHEEE